MHTIPCYQLQYNKPSTQQEKLSSKGKYTNIALYKSQSTFAYTISFDSLKKKKDSQANPEIIISYLQRKKLNEAQRGYLLI